MKKVVLLVMLLLPCLLHSQSVTKQEKGYFNITELEYFSGNNSYERQQTSTVLSITESGAYGWGLRNINGYFITNKISLGVGVGLQNFTHKDESRTDNTFQIFADLRYYFKNKNSTFFAYGDAGSSVDISTDFQKGALFNLGIGYKLKVGERSALLGSFGFVDQMINEPAPVLKNRYYGFGYKLGLLL